VVTCSGGTVTVMVKFPLAVSLLESVTVTETATEPAAVGVPVIEPLEETLKPSPAEPDQV